MTKMIFLLAPSEGKNIWWEYKTEKLSFPLEKPTEIAINVTEKDLKCKWDRFIEGIKLNKTLNKWPFTEAINRYSWVVFNAIDYVWMTKSAKSFFEENILIMSGMYWIIKPLDCIWNYKLPIETQWLYNFWWDKITNILNEINPDYIVNLLPNSYLKIINPKKINSKIININFLTEKEWKIVKFTHWVKKHRWEFLKNICENNLTNYEQFGWEVVNNWEFIEINIKK
jgi:cytoplasmic iron level regulating protein YaaA (DUF328/UPF0246 family)